MKIAFYTLGCKVNQYETQLMSEYFKNIGYTVVPLDMTPDVVLVNSCAVTAESERKSRRQVRKFHKLYPNAIIALAGCMPQADPDCYGDIPEADIITGNKNHYKLAELIEEYLKYRRQIIYIPSHDNNELFESSKIGEFEEHTRAFVKIEDGCNCLCSYCVIPYARGRVRSKSVADALDEIGKLYDNGFKEIVLVGINLSAYGSDRGESLTSLLLQADEKYSDIRIRLGSLEADLLDGGIITEWAKIKSLCPHFHLSLQSGCDDTLKRMNRKYSSADFLRLTDIIRNNFNNPSITTDIIVGFPGESESDFKASALFAKKAGFARIHVFPYSARKGTKAEKFENQISKDVKKYRVNEMLKIARASESEFLKSQIGKTAALLIEKQSGDFFIGYSENYSEIRIKSTDFSGAGRITEVKISDVNEEGKYLLGLN